MEWYYAKHGKQEGPVDLAGMQRGLQSGEIAPTDLVWREGMTDWLPAGEVRELSEAPVPPPPTPVAPVLGGSPAAASAIQGGYQAPVGGIAPTMVPVTTNGMAIASMVCGIVSLMMCYVHGLCALPAVICGHMALKQIGKSLIPMGGRGMAIAGLVTGYIGLLFQVLWIIGLAVLVMQEM